MLMEFAEERNTPFLRHSSAMPGSEKACFTALCASSKFPSMPTTLTFPPSCVIICSFCTALTPSEG